MKFFVYILRCADGYFYTGITANLKKRILEHRLGLSNLTKNRRPVKIVYQEGFALREEAAKREKEIKGWSRKKKENLIRVYIEESVYTEQGEVTKWLKRRKKRLL